MNVKFEAVQLSFPSTLPHSSNAFQVSPQDLNLNSFQHRLVLRALSRKSVLAADFFERRRLSEVPNVSWLRESRASVLSFSDDLIDTRKCSCSFRQGMECLRFLRKLIENVRAPTKQFDLCSLEGDLERVIDPFARAIGNQRGYFRWKSFGARNKHGIYNSMELHLLSGEV